MISAFGKQKLIRDISANTFQTGVTQLFGLIIFYLTSKYLPKNDFGEFNWSMAVGATIIAVGSLGLDLIFVKRIATGENVLEVSGIHFFHTVLVGAVLGIFVFIVKIFVPAFSSEHPLFFLVFLNLAIANVANSFKLCMNGLEEYKKLAILSFIANACKLGIIVIVFLLGRFSIFNVILAYAIASAVEFMAGYYLMTKSIAARVRPLLRVTEYRYFILESLPQLGVVLFDSALARIDWILLGIISTAAATAEYSFAYKIFELSKLPLLIIAPVLLTRFSKIFNNQKITDTQKKEISVYFRLEMFAIMLIPVFLVSAWTPLIDYFTDDKYGRVNEANFIILACCVPMHAIINFLWTTGFVQGQLKSIMYITIVVSVLNILANMALIPLFASLGAAIAFLACTIVQLALYIGFVDRSRFSPPYRAAVAAFLYAVLSVIIVKNLHLDVIYSTALSMIIYMVPALIVNRKSIIALRNSGK